MVRGDALSGVGGLEMLDRAHRFALSSAIDVVCDTLLDDIAELRHAAVGRGLVDLVRGEAPRDRLSTVCLLPGWVAPKFEARFAARFLACVMRVADELCAPAWAGTRCLAEDVAVYVLTNQAADFLNDLCSLGQVDGAGDYSKFLAAALPRSEAAALYEWGGPFPADGDLGELPARWCLERWFDPYHDGLGVHPFAATR